jgi:glycosyltransferase involved in cell wall biosynthesis
MKPDMRIAIVHFWFYVRGGAERVLETLAEMFPQADLYFLVANYSALPPELQQRHITTSFLQRIPGARKFHRHFLFLQPLALEQFDFSHYDLVISSEAGPAKGVITPPGTCHICYCHSPMRYIWDMAPQYRREMNPFVGLIFSLTAHYMRLWDFASSRRVDYFVANSHYVASRIRKFYGLESTVIHPPVDVSQGMVSGTPGDYYVTLGRLVRYKRFDLAVRACTSLGRPLRIIGDGPEYAALRKIAGPTVKFLGNVSESVVRDNLSNCSAMLFPGEEDFGIAPVEAQSYGRPVIAYASGGAMETVRGALPGNPQIDEPTGIFFPEQTASSLSSAILEFESRKTEFSPTSIREHSLQFDSSVFKKRMTEFIEFALDDFRSRSEIKLGPGSKNDDRNEAVVG